MATGPVTVLNVAVEKFGEAVFDLEGGSYRVVLTTSAQAIGAGFTGTSGQALYSDLTAEVIGDGYTPGGQPLAATSWSRSGAVATFDANSTAWASLTATMKYAVIVLSDGEDPFELSHILAYFDLEVDEPTGRTSAGGDFIINWSDGLFTLTRVDP